MNGATGYRVGSACSRNSAAPDREVDARPAHEPHTPYGEPFENGSDQANCGGVPSERSEQREVGEGPVSREVTSSCASSPPMRTSWHLFPQHH